MHAWEPLRSNVQKGVSLDYTASSLAPHDGLEAQTHMLLVQLSFQHGLAYMAGLKTSLR